VLRNWLIGSVIFHILFLAGAGVCLPCFSHAKPEELYLQLYAEPDTGGPDFEASASPESDVREEKILPAMKQTTPSVREKAPVQPVVTRPVAVHEQKRENPSAPIKQNIAVEPVKSAIVPEKAAPAPTIEAKESIKVSDLPKAETLTAGNPGVPAGPENFKEPIQLADIPVGNGPVSPGLGQGSGAKHEGNLPVPDVTPVMVYAPKREYPVQARKHNWEGKVWVKALVGIDGKVKEATVLESSGYSILDASALKSAKKRRYQPAQKDGGPVACFVKIPFTFKLEE
jgi:TonB family protein